MLGYITKVIYHQGYYRLTLLKMSCDLLRNPHTVFHELLVK